MPIILHPASERKVEQNHGIISRMTFDDEHSNPELTNFGLMVRLNDVQYSPSDETPDFVMQKNMEIIHIVIDGGMQYFDSSGNEGLIQPNISKLLSAGKGIYSGLKRIDKIDRSRIIEIQILPDKVNQLTRHVHRLFDIRFRENDFQLIAAPGGVQQSLPINQNAFISIGKFDQDRVVRYSSKNENHGIYFYLINGSLTIGGLKVLSGDGVGISDFDRVEFKTETDSEILVIELPMN